MSCVISSFLNTNTKKEALCKSITGISGLLIVLMLLKKNTSGDQDLQCTYKAIRAITEFEGCAGGGH